MLGTSDAWSMSRSSHRPSVLYWRFHNKTEAILSYLTSPFSAFCFENMSLCTYVHRLDFSMKLTFSSKLRLWVLSHSEAKFGTFKPKHHLRQVNEQRFVSSTGNMEVLLSHTHSIVCACNIEGQFLKVEILWDGST